jgi:hypothetical protein
VEGFVNPAGADEEFRISDDKKKGKLGEDQICPISLI